jgi:hypothetical protein
VADDQAVYVLDRTGNIRVAHQEPLVKAPGSAASLTGGSDPDIIFAAPDGATVRLRFDGTSARDTVAGLSAAHKTGFADIDGDNMTDRVTVEPGTVRAFGSNGSRMWTYSTGGTDLRGPWFLSTGPGERRTAVYDAGRGILHLIGRNGTSASGFPHRAGPFFNTGRVTNKSTWNLIVNENDTYICNYELIPASK